jgi:sialidase-1
MEILQSGIVYANPKPYLRSQHAFHPTLVNLGGGHWLCAYDLGDAVEGLDYGTHRSRSMDDGLTWTHEGAILTTPTKRRSTHSLRLSQTSAGLVGFGGRFYRSNLNEGLVNRANLGYVPMELLQVHSSNQGQTWSRPQVITPPLVGPAFETCHGIVELPSGRWLAPTSTWRGWDGAHPNGDQAVVLISDDRGHTWPTHSVTFDGRAEGLIHWEQSVVSLGFDEVLAISWVYHPASGSHRPNRYAVSHDGGSSFGPPAEIGIQAQTCKALHLRNGRLLLAYRRQDQPGLWLSQFQFDGLHWTLTSELPIWGTALASSGMAGTGTSSDELSALKFGFPQMQQADNDEVLLVFWCFEDWSTRIRWVRLRAA